MSQLQVTGEAKIREIQGPVVANDGVITALDGAASQYVRGDGTLADFPTSGGGGSSVSYYLNGSVNQGTFGGSTYYQMSKEAITGLGTNFSTSSDGLLAQFITDVNVPDVTEIPSGNWNLEFFMNVSASSGALASFYAEIYKWNGTTFTLIATNVATPEQLTNTTTVDAYFTSVAMPTTALSITDRIAIRIYANVAGKTVTLYTEDNRLCQVVTTFSRGVTSINNLTDQSQYLTTGTSGTNFNIDSSGDTHTFNLPIASATNTGKLSSTDWSIFNNKVPYTGANADVDLGFYSLLAKTLIANGNSSSSGSLHLKQNDTINVAGVNYGTIATNTLEQFVFYWENASFAKRFNLDFSLLAPLGTAKTFTLPDLSGTLALLEGTQTFTGIKTFNLSTINETGIQLKNDIGIVPVVSGYTNLNGLTNGLAITNSSGVSNNLLVPATVGYSYTFPASSGTLALTSNLTSYVPYTGATTDLSLGNNTLLSMFVFIEGNGTQGGILSFKQYGTSYTSTTDHTNIYATDTDKLNFNFYQSGGSGKSFTFNVSSLTANTNRTYTMPDANGILALTSDIPSLANYVTLDGTQTITGSKTFSAATVFSSTTTHSGVASFGTGSPTAFATDGTLIIPKIRLYNGTPATIYSDFVSAATTNRSITVPDASGTMALTSNLSAYLPLTGGSLSGALTIGAYSFASSAIQFTRATTNTISPASGNGIMVFGGGSSQIRINTNNAICFDMNNGGTPYTSLLLSQNGNTVLINSPDNTLALGLGYQGTYHGFLGGFSSALYAYSTNGGQVYLTSGSAWVPVSDVNRKKNFETYNLGLNAILGLEAKLYHMDFQEDSEEKQVGLIAQQVREHIPKAFEQNDKFIGLNYNVIIVTLVNAIQELETRVKQLENK